jgi:hypothetical protein
MLSSVLVLSALTLPVGQPGKLALSNARLTYGIQGPTRADTRFLPGDSLILSFDIEGVTTDDAGKVQYSTTTEVVDGKGNRVFQQPPRNLDATNALGGNTIPAYAQVDIGLQQPEGDYTLNVTVTDLPSRSTKTLTQKFQVLKSGFGVVRLGLSTDPDGLLPVPTPGVGQSVWVNSVLVGFERARGTEQPNVALEMRILDESGRPTVKKSFAGTIEKDVPTKAASLPVQFSLSLNRAGKFTLEIKATDTLSKKSVTQTLPITVQSPR